MGYLSEVLLHVVRHVGQLVFCPPLQMRDPVREPAVRRVQVPRDLPLVFLHSLLESVDDRSAVTRVAVRDRPLLDVASQVEEVLLTLAERLLRQRGRVRVGELGRVRVVVAAVGGPVGVLATRLQTLSPILGPPTVLSVLARSGVVFVVVDPVAHHGSSDVVVVDVLGELFHLGRILE